MFSPGWPPGATSTRDGLPIESWRMNTTEFPTTLRPWLIRILDIEIGGKRSPTGLKMKTYWSTLAGISAWSFNLNRSIVCSFIRDKIFKNESRADFITSWRPQTTFGYKNDFDFDQYQKTLRKRMSSLYSNSYVDKKLYAFDSHPHPQIMIKYCINQELSFSPVRKYL